MKRGDLWLAALLLIAAGAFVLMQQLPGQAQSDEHTGRYAEITVDGELYRTVELTGLKEQVITIQTSRGYNRLEIHDDGIQMHDADCPDQLCLSFGHIAAMGRTIVCLPNRVLVEIVGGSGGGEFDALVS